jgi:hypothetical protein
MKTPPFAPCAVLALSGYGGYDSAGFSAYYDDALSAPSATFRGLSIRLRSFGPAGHERERSRQPERPPHPTWYPRQSAGDVGS